MKLVRLWPLVPLAAAYACGGSDGSDLFDAGTDAGPADVSVQDQTVPPADGATDGTTGDDGATDASDGGVIEAGPLCLQTPCVVEIASGGFHSCARITDGTVRCWGRNNIGQLGVGMTDAGFDTSPHPVPVTPALANVTQITASHYSYNYSVTCVLAGGVPECFGANDTGQLGLSADAGVYDTNAHPTPAAVQGLPSTVKAVFTGNLHSCALDNAGALYCWGYNQTDQLDLLATGTNGDVLPARLVAFDAGATTLASPGYDDTLAIAGGTVYSWGGNTYGELGRTATSPSLAAPTAITGASYVAAGLLHACAIVSGALSCWGNDTNGELGDGNTNTTTATPVSVDVAGKQVSQVSAGYSHTCALAADGTVYCWGQNDWGQCGTGATDAGFSAADVLTPTQVQGLTGKALEVEAGTNHTCALIEGGSVMCWGADDRGQLGQGLVDAALDTSAHPQPVTVKFP